MEGSLRSQSHNLSRSNEQLRILEEDSGTTPFDEKIGLFGFKNLKPTTLDILQVNVGYMCNQTCKHCHVDAGPDRNEIMTRDTMEACLDMIRKYPIKTVDITGGAPEMNPNFRWFVEELRKTQVEEIIVRSNLTILVSNKEFSSLPFFFKEHRIRLVSSLPFYLPEKTDRQRGTGVFVKSIEALQKLNSLGYGRQNNLVIDLVYNPSGAFLPAGQEELERDFKRELKDHYDIDFNSLLTITNLPISRFLEYLLRSDNYEEYMEKLVMAFNPATLDGLMCRNTLSVGWDGYLYDCDFNQMLNLKIDHKMDHIRHLDLAEIANRKIITGNHCYGCTAGAGSSCQGSLV